MDNYIVHIVGDGNCLFRCFSYFLHGNQNLYNDLRHRIVKYISSNWSEYKPFILGNHYYESIFNSAQYCQFMSRDKTYGSEIEIRAFSKLYKTNVHVHMKDTRDLISFKSDERNSNLNLVFSGVNHSAHYDVLIGDPYTFCEDLKESFSKRKYQKEQHNIPAKKFKSYHYFNVSPKKFKTNHVSRLQNEVQTLKCDQIDIKMDIEGFNQKIPYKKVITRLPRVRLIEKPKKSIFRNPKDVNYVVDYGLIKDKKMKNSVKRSQVKFRTKYKNLNNGKKGLNHVSDYGHLDHTCKYCGAVYWKNERMKSTCCRNGKIVLSPPSNYDPRLRKMLIHDLVFRHLIRFYNNLFSFATFKAVVKNEKGIYNIKIQGQVCHTTPDHIIPNKHKQPELCQLYIYDDKMATDERLMRWNKGKKDLKGCTAIDQASRDEHMRILTDVMNHNPYAKQYKNLYNVTKNNKLSNHRLYFVRKKGSQQHTYNKPLTSECGAILVSDKGIPDNFDLCVYPRASKDNVKHTCLHKLSHHVDPMVFPIFYPQGDLGWSTGYKSRPDAAPDEKQLSVLDYYSYRLAYRPNHKRFSPLLFGGRLTQQKFIHAYVMVESNRMRFLRNNQKKLRIECYQGLFDAVQNCASNCSENFEKKERLGNLFILPSTFIGGPRYMQQHYQDAMAIMREKGRPDLFITMTCNPKWEELKRVLKRFPKGTTVNDIPGLTVRLFKTKLDELVRDIMENNIFGKAIAQVHTVEFQKRGLPHAHLLVTLHSKDKMLTSEAIDKHISAEIPTDDHVLQKLVLKHMLHGPHSYKTPCYDMDTKTCTKKYPKKFQSSTCINKDGYPNYRRRDNRDEGHRYSSIFPSMRLSVDNSMVVPYNKFLLKKYKCHINVEYCSSIQSIKYVYKYLHKGHDKALCRIDKVDSGKRSEIHDEIKEYIDGRYLSPMECAWRLAKFPLIGRSHCVERLPVHIENQQNIVFEESKELDALKRWKTHLISWFELNKTDPFARKIKYVNIPKYYSFNNSKRKWVRRLRSQKHETIGRLNVVSPKDGERFFLKLILNRTKGATCYKDLMTHDGVTYNSFRETAMALGLIETDEKIFEVFEEAISIMLPFQLRQFFAWFLIAEKIQGNGIWEKFKFFFIEDFKSDGENLALNHINDILQSEDTKCEDFGLPKPNPSVVSRGEESDQLTAEECKKRFDILFSQLNFDQKLIFEKLKSMENLTNFIDGPGGCGKTFLYKTLIYYFLSREMKVLSMAWTGIASILLPKGLTSHKTFKLPLDLECIESVFLKSDKDKKKLREAEIIIWDEASMIPKKALEVVDRTLRDVSFNDSPFGGKLVILGGDFRQILPVMKRANREYIVNETIKFSSLWPLFKVMNLKKNLRCEDQEFSNFLLSVGKGTINPVEIREEWKTDNVCESVYKNINSDDKSNRVVLSSHNEDVIKLNGKILKMLDGKSSTYHSIDYATHKGVDQTDDNIQLNYPVENLNQIREGLPPHKLELKVNAIVMLIRNISTKDGLCNGTRLKVRKLFKFNLKAEIITGENKGRIVFIPRITLNTGESSLPFILHRKQFPVVLAFAMTINKSQGQSFDKVGIYLRRPLFSHGQLYVALSRCKNPKNLYIENRLDNADFLDNVVWKEVFN